LRYKNVNSCEPLYLVLRSVKKNGGLKVWTPQEVRVPDLYPLAPSLKVWVFSARRHDC
jgi:hypothetical protein